MQFEIRNRFTGGVQITAEIECADDDSTSFKLGLAVRWAVTSRANLSGADLYGANLSGADLSRADLSRADLSRADLHGANLSGADLYGANLSGADLSRADLSRADLSGADLSGAENSELAIARTRILPEGDLIGWKKLQGGVIAKLRIPADAKRSHAFGRKCRAEFADVIEGEGISQHDGKTKYAPGERVVCDQWSEDWQEECAGGIHFYITRAEAKAH
jgi:hypothetical protein